MPIYEYVCKKCSHQFELLRLSSNGFKDIACPECGSAKAEKKLSTFSASVSGSSADACSDGACPAPSMGACGSGMCGLS